VRAVPSLAQANNFLSHTRPAKVQSFYFGFASKPFPCSALQILRRLKVDLNIS
jgi:hypothetical protein